MDKSRILSVSEARGEFSEIVNEAVYQEKRTILTKHGEQRAAVVPINDLRVLLVLDDVLDVVEATEALEEYRKLGGEPLDDVMAELGMTD